MHARRLLICALVALPFCMARNAVGAETWKVTGGRTTFNFYAGLLQDHGITLEQVDITASTPDPIMMDLEPPYWSWAITPESDLEFSVENEHFVFYAIKGGAIRHQGGLTFKDAVSGTSRDLRNWVMDYVATDHDGPGGEPDPAIFFGRQPQVGSPYTVYFHDEMPIFRRDQKRLIMYATAKITADWAQQLGRPWLADQAIARIEVAADVEYVSGASTEAPFEPIITGTLRDVKLGFLDSITELGHVGTYPNGTSGVSMATTSCNIGDVDVNWFAPMNPDHPGIVMSIYRLLNGRFEQVGLSYVKHGFYALSSSQCTPCQHPSPGTFLGVGCSDTYSSGNNGDRTYLGPRREWNPFTSMWTCSGSHFSGGVADCARRHSGGGHDAVQHRCETKDADLNNPSATYYYEGYYLVSGDMVKHNNIGSRRTTMSWTGSGWNFSTPSSSNPLIEGPAIERWGDLRSEFGVAPGDGKAILASATTDLGGGQTHYEYALYNFDSYREVGKISIPVGETAVISNMEFHDWDGNAANDWTMTLANGYITWETTPFVSDSTANAVTFGMLMNFRFDANVPPSGTGAFAQLTPWRPGPVSSPKALTKVPATATSVPAIATTPTIRLGPARPNPLDPTTTIHFELSHESDATVEVFGAEGRRVRTLQTGRLSAGAHQLVWDGTDSDGTRVAPGVYYYRLTAGSEMAAQSLVVIR